MAASSLTIDDRSRRLLRATACLLRSIGPENGQVEIRLHDLARELEEIAGPAGLAVAAVTSAGQGDETGGGGPAKVVLARPPPPPLSPGKVAG